MKFRSGLIAILLVGLSGLTVPLASAQTSTETSVTVSIVDEGSLDIAWASSGLAFLADGESPAMTAGSPAVTATATFSLAIADTRADGSRPGYTVSVRADAFTAEGSSSVIGPELLTIVDLGGFPEGTSGATAIGATLDAPVPLLTVASDAPAIAATIEITVAMTLPPGTAPGAYNGGLTFDVLANLTP
jgi:hypothetical protein